MKIEADFKCSVKREVESYDPATMNMEVSLMAVQLSPLSPNGNAQFTLYAPELRNFFTVGKTYIVSVEEKTTDA